MLESIDDTNYSDFLAAPTAVLLVGKTTCPACNDWSTELLNNLLDTGPSTGLTTSPPLQQLNIRWGKLLLNNPGTVTGFKREHAEWLSTVRDLPYNSIWINGERVKEWPGGGMSRLVGRLQNLGLLPIT